MTQAGDGQARDSHGSEESDSHTEGGVKSGDPQTRIRLVIADDHQAILDAVSHYAGRDDDLEIVGTAADGPEALRLIEERRPDVAVIDIKMPTFGGIEILRRLHESDGATAVILYTGYPERNLLLESLDVGARGFLLKESVPLDLIRAVRAVAAGGTYIDPVLAGVIVSPEAAGNLVRLSKRERQILRLLADGMRNEEVGRTLLIAPSTVASHVQNAMTKLEADTRTQAVASALRQALIS